MIGRIRAVVRRSRGCITDAVGFGEGCRWQIECRGVAIAFFTTNVTGRARRGRGERTRHERGWKEEFGGRGGEEW